MAVLTIPDHAKVTPTQNRELIFTIDLYQELQDPFYFCPGIGGVHRDLQWIAGALEQAGIAFAPGELIEALNGMVQEGTLTIRGGRDGTGGWHLSFTLDHYEPWRLTAYPFARIKR